LCVHGKVRNIV